MKGMTKGMTYVRYEKDGRGNHKPVDEVVFSDNKVVKVGGPPKAKTPPSINGINFHRPDSFARSTRRGPLAGTAQV